MKYRADIIKDIEEPQGTKHQTIATDIFWRLQQGESLNYMEIAHAQLSSLTRNFIVKYADDQTFNYEKYAPVDNNPDKLKFFSLLDVDNNRMKHLQLMARFVMIEQRDGYAKLSDKKMEEFIDEAKQDDGIGNTDFEKTTTAINTLKTLKIFFDIFKDDPMPDSNSGIKELRVEYFIISMYVLIRHLSKYYVLDDAAKNNIREFIYDFHHRTFDKSSDADTDMDILTFRDKRQQGEHELEVRDCIARQEFFKYLKDKKIEIIEKDSKRAFTELERIIIYRKGKGICQECKRGGKPERESTVSWSKYQADHVVPHAKGGRTSLDNSELLCSAHNQSKGDSVIVQ